MSGMQVPTLHVVSYFGTGLLYPCCQSRSGARPKIDLQLLPEHLPHLWIKAGQSRLLKDIPPLPLHRF